MDWLKVRYEVYKDAYILNKDEGKSSEEVFHKSILCTA